MKVTAAEFDALVSLIPLNPRWPAWRSREGLQRETGWSPSTRTLNGLVLRGLVKREVRGVAPRTRFVYRVTPAGRRAVRARTEGPEDLARLFPLGGSA